MDPYMQPKRAFSGGFDLTFALPASSVSQTLITAKQTEPLDAPKQHIIHVQRLTVIVRTASATKTWSIQDGATSDEICPTLDMSVAGAQYTFDFGPQGIAITQNADLELVISANGAAGDIYLEGFQERTKDDI
jgi:hypothetical protein